MIVELILSLTTTTAFGVVIATEYFAQASPATFAEKNDRSNRPVKVLLGSCVLLGNLVIWLSVFLG